MKNKQNTNELKSYVSPSSVYGQIVSIYINLGYSVKDACDAATESVDKVIEEICKFKKSQTDEA